MRLFSTKKKKKEKKIEGEKEKNTALSITQTVMTSK